MTFREIRLLPQVNEHGNMLLITNGPVEVQDLRKPFILEELIEYTPKLMKTNQTCYWLDLEIFGSQPIMHENLPGN